MSKKEKEPFDLNVTKRDPNTNKEVGREDYTLHLEKGKGAMYERPPGSNIFFHPNGERITIEGDVQTKVAIDKDGKTKEEFEKEQTPQGKKSKE